MNGFRILVRQVLLLLGFVCFSIIAAPDRARADEQVAFPKPVQAYLNAAKDQMVYDPGKALSAAKNAELAAGKLPDSSETRIVALATARWLRAEAYIRTGEETKARSLVERTLGQVLKIGRPLKVHGDLLLTLASLQISHNEPARALANCHDAFRVFEKIDDKRSQSRALQMIATLYEYANDNRQAEKYYRQAGDIYKGDPLITLSLENNLGNVLLQLERYKDARDQYQGALQNAKKLKNPVLQVRVLGNLARTQVEGYDLDEAERTLRQGFALAKHADAQPYIRPLQVTAARVAFSRGDLAKAERLISVALEGVDFQDTSAEYRDAHLFAYQIYEVTGDTKQALAHLEALKRITDRASKVASTANAALAAARFDYKNQELRIAKLKAEELRRNVEYERSQARFQRILFVSIGGATLILIAMLSVGLVTIRRSRNEVRAANDDLAETNVALERALAAKTEFLATTSHEIRTPLNGILGMTQVMLRDPALPAAARDRLNVVHGAGMTMRSLVDDILDVAKMETGNMTVETLPMNLIDTLNEVSRMWEEQARGRGLAFELDVANAPRWIESDPSRLRQVIFNLLSNALKFTSEGAVGLRATVEQADGDERLRIAVSDSGIGIPEEKQAEIFESFKQVDAGTTRQYGGTGLGLAICRNLAIALGGGISVSSTPGKGSTFTLDLPLIRAAAPTGADRAGSGEKGAGGLLILDRNPIARSMLRTLLEPRAGSVTFAGTVAEALRAVAAGEHACLLVDEATLKEEPDGAFAALSTVAEAAAKKSLVVAVLWKSPDAEARAAIESSGIRHLIEKPIAGVALAHRLFGDGHDSSDKPPLVSRAA